MVSRYNVATIQRVFRCPYVFCRHSAERCIRWDDSVDIKYSSICSVSKELCRYSMVSGYTVAMIQKVFRCQYVFCMYSFERRYSLGRFSRYSL